MMRMPSGREAGSEEEVERDLMVKRARNWASRGVGGEGEQSVCSREAKVGAAAEVEAEEDAMSMVMMIAMDE